MSQARVNAILKTVVLGAVAVALSAGLIGCAPAATEPAPLEVASLGEADARALTLEFKPVLDALGVSLTQTRGYRYAGSDDNAFLRVIDSFYRENPGFCPVEGGFHAGGNGRVFLTLAARGTLVRGFVYDLSARPRLQYIFLAGSSRASLKTQPCRTVGQ